MNAEAARIVAQLGLAPLPREGGFFRRTWTGPASGPHGRTAGTVIYFLVAPGEFSALHRMQTDEVWFYHSGDAVEHVQLDPAGGAIRVSRLGTDLAAGELPQLIVPGGVWQGARLAEPAARGWALLSCAMAPGWDDADFELGERAALQRDFPAAADAIAALTR